MLLLFQTFLPRQSQEPKLLPVTNQLTELWGLGVEVLQGNGCNRLQPQSAPPPWMEIKPHNINSVNEFLLYTSLAMLYLWKVLMHCELYCSMFIVAYL